MKFTGKSAVVVGGAGGIGLELCRKLLTEQICKLAIIDVQDKQTEVLKQLNDDYSDKYIVYVKTNVAEYEQLIESFAHVVQKFGHIDIVINAAGIFNDKNVNETLTVNVGGVINATILSVNHMRRDKGGNGGIVVNVSSVAGLDPIHLMPVYSASKEAIVAFTRAFSHDYYYAKTGVRLVTICPGATITTFLDNYPDKMIYSDEDEAMKLFTHIPKQSADALAQHIVETMPSAENGSVWTCDNNIMKKVTFTKGWQNS